MTAKPKMSDSSSSHGRKKRIVIVGGGTAGWMAAATLAHASKGGRCIEVQLIESDEIGTIGVGEATIPGIRYFNERLGIDEREFMRATQGTFKAGIEFWDWTRLGDKYFHQFGNHGTSPEGISFHHFWLKLCQSGVKLDIGDFTPSGVAAKLGRFALPPPNSHPDLPALGYAYQFDAGLYAKFLRAYAETRGVVRTEGKITKVHQRGEDGFIEGVSLENGARIDGDFFVDCSGFHGLLIEKTLEAGFEDWSHWLPCDRALAVPCESTADILPYTRATAREAGWQWRIPLQHRIGNGHVYCSEFISDDQAADTLLKNLDGRALGNPRPIKFKAGRRKKVWSKNCLALGLSSGFLEPLESTAIHLIQVGLFKLVQLMPLDEYDPPTVDEFNRLAQSEMEHIRDFIVLHYTATERDDSPFWNYVRTMSIPDSLRHRIDIFRSRGRIARHDGQLFADSSWIAVMLGQNVVPKHYDPFVDAEDIEAVSQTMHQVRDSFYRVVNAMPMHRDFLSRYCPAPAM